MLLNASVNVDSFVLRCPVDNFSADNADWHSRSTAHFALTTEASTRHGNTRAAMDDDGHCPYGCIS